MLTANTARSSMSNISEHIQRKSLVTVSMIWLIMFCALYEPLTNPCICKYVADFVLLCYQDLFVSLVTVRLICIILVLEKYGYNDLI